MKEKIVKIEKGKEGVALPSEFLMHLELTSGAEVELLLDKEKKWIIIRPLHGEDFTTHFADSMKTMA